jgi:hypothetical protein
VTVLGRKGLVILSYILPLPSSGLRENIISREEENRRKSLGNKDALPKVLRRMF